MLFDDELETKDSIVKLRITLLVNQKVVSEHKTSFEQSKQSVFDLRRETVTLKFKAHRLTENSSTKELISVQQLCSEVCEDFKSPITEVARRVRDQRHYRLTYS